MADETDWKGYADDYLSGDPKRLERHLPEYLRDGAPVIDGRDPKMIEHLCIKDLQIHDGPVEDCCLNEWREERAALG